MPQKYSEKNVIFFLLYILVNGQSGSTTTDREPTNRKQTDREQTDREQPRLAETGYPEFIFTIPRAILPKLSLCDETTATKSVTKSL